MSGTYVALFIIVHPAYFCCRKDVRCFVDGGPKGIKPTFEGCTTVADALIVMLKKPGANLPLLPAGVPFPPPPSRPTTRQLRFEIPEDNQEPAPLSASRAASPTKTTAPMPVRTPSPVKSLQGPTAVRHASPATTATFDNAADMHELSAGAFTL